MKKKYVYIYDKICPICNNPFQTQRYGTKICSDICVKSLLAKKQKKYTDEQVDLAISLREQGVILLEITKQTGIKKPSLQKIFQENNVKLSEEDKKIATSRRWLGHGLTREQKRAEKKAAKNIAKQTIRQLALENGHKNDAEHLVQTIDGKRYFENKPLRDSFMIWKCSTERCATPPTPQLRAKYRDRLLCRACSLKERIKTPEC